MTAREDILIKEIEEDLRLQKEAGFLEVDDFGNEWTKRFINEPKRFLKEGTEVKRLALRNFRRNQILVPELPVGRQNPFNIRNIVDGARRGHTAMLKEYFKIIEDVKVKDILKKYPCSKVGNPHIFRHKGCAFTFRWVRHIYLLGLIKKYIAAEVKEDFTMLDLGSSYGILSSLVKREFPKSHHILVDLPQQLSLAHYFLGLELPNATIATYKDLAKLDVIDNDTIKKYDFILVPVKMYTKIARQTVDVFTNFMSLGEMSRKYFEYYLKQEPFLSAKIFFTVNRYQSSPTYDSGLSILDYPLTDFKRIIFNNTPIVSKRYKRFLLFFNTCFPYPSQHFEFIGKRS